MPQVPPVIFRSRNDTGSQTTIGTAVLVNFVPTSEGFTLSEMTTRPRPAASPDDTDGALPMSTYGRSRTMS